MEKVEVKKMCHDHMYRYVCVWMEDGSMHDGIIESMDEEYLSLAVPVESEYMNEMHTPMYTPMYAPMYAHHGGPCGCTPPPCGDMRAFFPMGGHGGGFHPGRRRFRRLLLPLIGITALSLLPLL